MKKSLVVAVFALALFCNTAHAQVPAAVSDPAAPVQGAEELSQYTYSYGTVLKASNTEIVLQEYDYDSDVEKEVVYKIDPAIKLEGIKAVTELVADDVVEVYYKEENGAKVAKIIRKETVEEESLADQNMIEEGN